MFEKQLFIFILQCVTVGIFDLVDAGFGNSLGIDSVCALAAYCLIDNIVYSIFCIGSYAYRVLLGKEEACLAVQMVVGVFFGVLVFFLRDVIPHLYSLTDSQYELLSQCLTVYAFTLPVHATGEFFNCWLTYSCMNRHIFVSNVIFWAFMIVGDILAVNVGGSLVYVVIATSISWVAYDIYVLLVCWKKHKDRGMCLGDIKAVFRYGSSIVFERIMARGCVMFYDVCASHIGTMQYAIHSVCLKTAVFSECISNGMHQYQIVRLSTETGDKYKKLISLLKKYYVFEILLAYLLCFLLTFVLHGSVPISDVWKYFLLYMFEIFPVIFYDSFKAYFMSIKNMKPIQMSGFVGMLVRVPLSLFFWKFGIVALALIHVADYAARALCLYVNCRKGVVENGQKD